MPGPSPEGGLATKVGMLAPSRVVTISVRSESGIRPPGDREGRPQAMDVVERGVDATVTAAQNGQVQDVRAQAVDVQVTDGGAGGQFVTAHEGGVAHASRGAHALAHELRKRAA